MIYFFLPKRFCIYETKRFSLVIWLLEDASSYTVLKESRVNTIINGYWIVLGARFLQKFLHFPIVVYPRGKTLSINFSQSRYSDLKLDFLPIHVLIAAYQALSIRSIWKSNSNRLKSLHYFRNYLRRNLWVWDSHISIRTRHLLMD